MKKNRLSHALTAGLLATVFLMFLAGCQSTGSSSAQGGESVSQLVNNVKAENQEMLAEETDGNLYEPGDYESDPTYSSFD